MSHLGIIALLLLLFEELKVGSSLNKAMLVCVCGCVCVCVRGWGWGGECKVKFLPQLKLDLFFDWVKNRMIYNKN